MMRERRKGVRAVVQKCLIAAERRSITTQSSLSLSLSQLVLLCLQSVEDSTKSEESYGQIIGLEESNKDSTNDRNNHDDYCDDNDNDDNHMDDHNHEGVRGNQSKSNYMKNESINIHRYNDNYDDNDDNNAVSNNEKKEYRTTAREEQLCQERIRRARLAVKLLEHPETYLAVLDILGNVRFCTCSYS